MPPMIADTFHLNQGAVKAPGPIGPDPNTAEPRAPIAQVAPFGEPIHTPGKLDSVNSHLIKPTGAGLIAAKRKAAEDEVWRHWHQNGALMPGPRLELGERDARLVALDLALRFGEHSANAETAVKRAEAFLAFLAGRSAG